MTPSPQQVKIYHITHVENLYSIVQDGGIVSDAAMIARGGPKTAIGMSNIKRRRVEDLEVDRHPGTKVGEYVPFYFCPRSIMLYVIHCANHPELSYRGGQGPIVHLEANVDEVVNRADADGQRWAFSLSNAGSYMTEFRANLADLNEIDWTAVSATDFRPPQVREGKQSEFLVHNFFPWDLIRRIGVCTLAIKSQVDAGVSKAQHKPSVEVQPSWYY